MCCDSYALKVNSKEKSTIRLRAPPVRTRAMHSVSGGLKRLKRSTGWLRATSQQRGVLWLSAARNPTVQASLANTFDASAPWQVLTRIFCRVRWARTTCDAVSNDLSQAV